MTVTPTHLHATPARALAQPAPLSPAKPPARRYFVQALTQDGDWSEHRHAAPALPLFEDAFCAFARGALVQTETGPVAIEDLLPGDRVLTTEGDPQPVIWKGAVTIQPGPQGQTGRHMALTRILADSFGMGRPLSGLVAGPAARLLQTPERFRAMAGGNRVLIPASTLVDGATVIETTPPSAVELFHICLPVHAVITINGLDVESYHPGLHAMRGVSPALQELYFRLFPHATQISDFGPVAYPRIGDGPGNAVEGSDSPQHGYFGRG